MSTEKAIKNIAEDFLSDSRDFLKRFKILLEPSLYSPIGMRSKLLVDLLFSAECCIKALILRDSNTSTLENFFSHDLTKLLPLLSETDYSFCVSHLDGNFITFSVENRYMMETHKIFRTNQTLNETYYNTIANFQWFTEVPENIQKMIDYASSKIDVPIRAVKISEIDLEENKMITEYKTNFKKQVKKRKKGRK